MATRPTLLLTTAIMTPEATTLGIWPACSLPTCSDMTSVTVSTERMATVMVPAKAATPRPFEAHHLFADPWAWCGADPIVRFRSLFHRQKRRHVEDREPFGGEERRRWRDSSARSMRR